MMRICDKCGLPIRSYMYWSKYIDGEKVYICNDCVSALPDIRTTNGLDLVIDKENKERIEQNERD